MTTKYRINWKLSRMKMEGHGKPVFKTRDEAQIIVDRLNVRHKKGCTHWVEPVEVKEEQCNPED